MDDLVQREGESPSTFRKRKWRTVQRVKDAGGVVVSRRQIPVAEVTRPRPLNPKLARVSTLYDGAGEVRAQWQIETPGDRARSLWMQEALDALRTQVDPIPAIPVDHNRRMATDTMVAYPIGDHHLGMLSWKPETGADYDLTIGEKLLTSAFDNLVRRAPDAATCLIAVLGDFMHYDSMIPQTPHGKNQLDSDGRYQKMIRVALRCLCSAIEAALSKHTWVSIILEPGNHDPFSTTWLVEALRLRYGDNERVHIDDAPGHYHYMLFGKVLIGTHHGDKAKAEALPEIMAADRPMEWALAEHRYWWTGHRHSQSLKTFRGCSVECFNILAPTDAWATESGYRSRREMHAIVIDRDHGEVERYIVNPSMVGM